MSFMRRFGGFFGSAALVETLATVIRHCGITSAVNSADGLGAAAESGAQTHVTRTHLFTGSRPSILARN